MKTLTPLLLAFIFLFSCTQPSDIEAELKGLGNDTITVEYFRLSQNRYTDSISLDTIYPIGGKFTYSIPADEPVLLIIDPHMGRLDSGYFGFSRNHFKFITILLKPGDKISVKGEMKELYTDFIAEGSSFNEEYSLIRQQYIEEVSEAVQISMDIDSLAEEGGHDKLLEELDQQRRTIFKIEDEKQIEYIKNNLNNELSAYYLSIQFSDTVAKYYPLLSEDIRNGIFETWLNEMLESYKWEMDIKEAKLKTQEGAIAPDFLLESMLDTYYSLDSVKKEFVVLDFWGSWCSPCVAGFPKMKAYYTRYNEEIEFIGIACYETDDAWKKSIVEHDANWVQLINREKSENDAALSYGVWIFPTKFILDKDRRIISRSEGEANEFYETLDELMTQK